MRRTLVLNVVGLTPRLVGEHTPNLLALSRRGALRPLRTVSPAVTCSVQSSLVTGLLPRDHGCVANGWYFRDTSEVALWKQSNKLVSGEKIWDAAKRRDPAFTCAKLFWWYNMYSTADWAVTPRPQYPADGRKIPDFYTQPASLHGELLGELGPFPLFDFWGPRAGIRSTEWIGRCAAQVFQRQQPTLTLVYLPHLDYNLQRLGPEDPQISQDLRAVDAVCGELIHLAERSSAAVVVLSEYGITPVAGPVHINRVLRQAGLLEVRREEAGEQLDAGASEAFAVADHQVAHVYVRRRERVAEVAELLRVQPGIEEIWDENGKRANGLDHPRSGELIAVTQANRWFTYYHWLDDDRAPDYARTVDIHRKPGYDPAELFIDPELPEPQLKVALTLLKRKLGFRTLLDVIPLDPGMVRGSHGRLTDSSEEGPVFITSDADKLPPDKEVHALLVKEIVLAHLFG